MKSWFVKISQYFDLIQKPLTSNRNCWNAICFRFDVNHRKWQETSCWALKRATNFVTVSQGDVTLPGRLHGW